MHIRVLRHEFGVVGVERARFCYSATSAYLAFNLVNAPVEMVDHIERRKPQDLPVVGEQPVLPTSISAEDPGSAVEPAAINLNHRPAALMHEVADEWANRGISEKAQLAACERTREDALRLRHREDRGFPQLAAGYGCALSCEPHPSVQLDRVDSAAKMVIYQAIRVIFWQYLNAVEKGARGRGDRELRLFGEGAGR
ncbi:hypothetical protein GCM10011591_24430 [Nocardia camponoti]|uniref:Uncharacterized protein n=1 Tax=Nocardia camponoti TaxID=1616106 RepID=A0A917QIT4_9NOCA|nr:hypothetical protein GCM10011591_24430 [Nocardia camponoti]